jgi:oligopeptide transport system permease protein
VFPASFLTATVLAFIMLGDAVRDAFDPKLR